MDSENKLKVEFSVQTTCNECRTKIENVLASLQGVDIHELNVAEQKLIVQVDSDYLGSVQDIAKQIESQTEISTVFKGLGSSQAAVAEIEGADRIIGVVRLSQLMNRQCLVDGVLDGLDEHQCQPSLNIHEYGDLSGKDWENVGPVFVPISSHLESISGRSSFKLAIGDCDLSACIGRSMAITDRKKKQLIAGGIIARASPVEGNVKKVCACSGKTLWEEREDQMKSQKSRAS